MPATCGTIGSDQKVTVKLTWISVDPFIGPPQTDHQVVKVWLWISVSDERVSVLEQTVNWGIRELAVTGLAQGNTYIWVVETVYPDGSISVSEEASFITKSVPPGDGGELPPGGFAIPMPLILIAAGAATLFIISKAPGSTPKQEVAALALLPP